MLPMPLQVGKGRVKKLRKIWSHLKNIFHQMQCIFGKITALSKTGISNHYNVIAKYIRSPSKIISQVLQTFDKCWKKVACQVVRTI